MNDRLAGILRKILSLLRKLVRILGYAFLAYLVIVAIVVWLSGDDDFDARLHDYVVNDITELNPVPMAAIVTPQSVHDIVTAIKSTTGPVAIGGGRFSMGGQTAIDNGVQLDMRDYDDVVWFSAEDREITVQSGMSWRELQEYIDPHDLSVKIMQTYANFSVGGSLSVNVHGRYIGHGPVIYSVKAIQLVLADGSVVDASPVENEQLFYAAIGGYGGIAVISEVTLELAENTRVGRKTTNMPIGEYYEHFRENVRDNDDVVFHNADIYPPQYEKVRDVSWYVTNEDLTIDDRLIATDDSYWLLPKMVEFSNSGSFGKWTRRNIIDPLYYASDRVAMRNWEASYDVRELGEGDRSDRTWVLQEYFIPVGNFDDFVPKMRAIFQEHEVDVVNVSIRHALPDPGSLLAWAREEVFAFVVYHSQGTTTDDMREVGVWTRKMIDAILSEEGSYYLPYQPHATVTQFRAAYPGADEYFAVKREVDPENRFQNKLWEKYYPTTNSRIREFLDAREQYHKGEEQSFLTLPEWYLVFNPNEYADFLERGNNPSDFPFFASINEYWTLYDRVTRLTDGLYPNNDEYLTMLWVIGVSTTAEFVAKSFYENTIGRLTRWTASGDTPEDLLIQRAHRAYADLLDYEVWYVFPFWQHAKGIWDDTPFFGANFIRKFERKLIFTAEFGFKAMYAKLIGFGAAAAYDAPAELVTLHVVADGVDLTTIDNRIKLVREFDAGHAVITVPRWGPFTEIVPRLAARGVQFVEIAGNDEIVMTTLREQVNDYTPNGAQPLFDSVVMSPAGMQRNVYLVRVENLQQALNGLRDSGVMLEHVFDY